MKNSKCKICRRAGEKLFLKGDRCLTAKCSIVKKPYPPGIKGKNRRRNISEYGKELKEKQKLKNWYNLSEKQFSRYVKQVLDKRGLVEDASALLLSKLESRLDNVVFRMGLADSHTQARQMVNHGHFLINNRKMDIPSYQVKRGDKVMVRPQSKDIGSLKNIQVKLKKYKAPSWLRLNPEKLEGEITKEPFLEEATPIAEISAIFEYYSR